VHKKQIGFSCSSPLPTVPRSVAHLNKAAFKGGCLKLGESQGLGESLRLSPIIGESFKLSPKLGESFRGELCNMKEL